MAKWTRPLNYLAWGMMLSGMMVPPAADAATLLFEAQGGAFKNSKLIEEGNIIGLVGDLVELRNGDHEIHMAAPHDYTMIMTLRVDGRSVKVVKTEKLPSNCGPVRKVEWPLPQVRGHDSYKGVRIVALPPPKFGARTGVGSCAQPSMMSCQKNKVILTANSEPNNAEIWIDEEKVSSATNTTLSVPYCEYEKTKSVLIRMKGKINCKQDIELSPDRRLSISCQLRDP